MTKLKITIIGAGSSYTPELIEGLVSQKDGLPVDELAFVDIDENRLEIMAGFCRRLFKRLGHIISITATTDRRAAIKDAQFVVTQIRVGGNAQRVLDEKIPLKYGVIGQETTGPGGMFKALRTIPVMLEIARDVEQVAPSGWIINYANPTGMLAEAVSRYSHARIAGLCSGALHPRWLVSHVLDVPPELVHYDYFGLNHLNFAYNIRVGGRLITEAEFNRLAEKAAWGAVDPAIIKAMGLLPIGYLQYYFHRSHKVSQARNQPYTRGEEVQRIEQEVFEAYADETQDTIPPALAKRGGGGYSEVAMGVMNAIYNNTDKVIIVNVPHQGAVHGFPAEATFELPSVINANGIFPLHIPEIPRAVWGLVAAVKNYEQLAVEAAVTGNRETALLALMAHPLVGDYDVALPMLNEMLEANRSFLPQFFRKDTL